MFVEDGLTVEQIAKKRSLTISTVVNHLCHYVAQGEIEPADIMTPERVEAIADYLATAPSQGVVTAHEALKGEYSYDEIRLVMAWIKANC